MKSIGGGYEIDRGGGLKLIGQGAMKSMEGGYEIEWGEPIKLMGVGLRN